MGIETNQENTHNMSMVLDNEDKTVKKQKQEGFGFWIFLALLMVIGLSTSIIGVTKQAAFEGRTSRNDSALCVAFTGLSKHVGYNSQLNCADFKYDP